MRQNQTYPQINYAIVTALYQNEFEEIKNLIDFPESEIFRTQTKEYYIGYLKANRTVKVVAGIPSATGMVDSAIIATQMLEIFKPEYLLMSGVCGGSSDMAIGDIVVGKQFFTFQKGKVSDVYAESPEGIKQKLQLYDNSGNLIDYDKLVDQHGNLVSISIEKFEIEHDAMIDMPPLLKDKIERNRERIQYVINETLRSHGKKIKIHIEPIACSMMVINKEGYFEDKIKVVNRKTAAVEIESYAVARACQFANEGRTFPLIFKAVMDNTKDKVDSAKRHAAHTSALFLKSLLENNVLD